DCTKSRPNQKLPEMAYSQIMNNMFMYPVHKNPPSIIYLFITLIQISFFFNYISKEASYIIKYPRSGKIPTRRYHDFYFMWSLKVRPPWLLPLRGPFCWRPPLRSLRLPPPLLWSPRPFLNGFLPPDGLPPRRFPPFLVNGFSKESWMLSSDLLKKNSFNSAATTSSDPFSSSRRPAISFVCSLSFWDIAGRLLEENGSEEVVAALLNEFFRS